jgi:signal transduction histidine kinase
MARYRWLQARGGAEVGPEGHVVRVTGTGQDITDLRRATIRSRRLAAERAAREAAQAAERRMAFLARASAELASSLDYETTLVTVARLAVPEMADWCAVDLVDEEGSIRRLAAEHQDAAKVALVRRLTEQYPPSPQTPRGIAEVIRTGRTELGREVPDELLVQAARNQEHLDLLRSLGLRSYVIAPLVVRGRVLGAMTFVHAESGRRYDQDDCLLVEDLARRAAVAIEHAQLVRELSRALQAKSDFMATMSHELRTPLNAIIGYAELLVDGIPEPIPAAPELYVQRIGLAAQHLLELINEILTFARLQAGREAVEVGNLDVDQLVDEIKAIINPLAAADDLNFRVTIGKVPQRVTTDPRKVRQILLNLLGNAVKFTDRGSVELRVEQQDNQLLFHVTDTGPGIPPEEQRYLFEPFWQGDQTATRRSGGAGLGLPISERLARVLGGDIMVESEAGAGSRFTLRLPLDP